MWHIGIETTSVRGEWMEDSYRWFDTYRLKASNLDGVCYYHFHIFTERKQSVEFRDRVYRSFKFSPAGKPGIWEEGRPVYGSPEYQRTGGDREWQSDIEPEMLGMSERQCEQLAWERGYFGGHELAGVC